MAEEVNYFWLNCGYTRWNHNEPLVGQTTLFESGAQFNPTQGFRAFKKLKLASSDFYQVQTDTGLLGIGEIISVQTGAQNKIRVEFKFNEELKPLTTDYLKRSEVLDYRMNNMRETLINQLTKEEFQLIVELEKVTFNYLDISFYLKLKNLNLILIIRFLHILIMELNGMVIIFITN